MARFDRIKGIQLPDGSWPPCLGYVGYLVGKHEQDITDRFFSHWLPMALSIAGLDAQEPKQLTVVREYLPPRTSLPTEVKDAAHVHPLKYYPSGVYDQKRYNCDKCGLSSAYATSPSYHCDNEQCALLGGWDAHPQCIDVCNSLFFLDQCANLSTLCGVHNRDVADFILWPQPLLHWQLLNIITRKRKKNGQQPPSRETVLLLRCCKKQSFHRQSFGILLTLQN